MAVADCACAYNAVGIVTILLGIPCKAAEGYERVLYRAFNHVAADTAYIVLVGFHRDEAGFGIIWIASGFGNICIGHEGLFAGYRTFNDGM